MRTLLLTHNFKNKISNIFLEKVFSFSEIIPMLPVYLHVIIRRQSPQIQIIANNWLLW